jgi:hypothetical protein
MLLSVCNATLISDQMTERKGKTWVLDTGTKGTGAEMVPLEKVLKAPGPGTAPAVVSGRRRQPVPPKTPEPREPRRFKVVDAMSGQVLAADVDARTALDVMPDARSVVDLRVYVWQPRSSRWRMLTVAEQKAMWELRD